MLGRSLRHRFAIVIAGACATTLACTAAGILFYDHDRTRAAHVQALQAVAAVVGDAGTTAMRTGSAGEGQSALALLEARTDLRMAALYDRAGRVVARVTRAPGVVVPPEAPAAGLTDDVSSVRVVQDVCGADGCVGSVLVETDRSAIHARWKTILSFLLVVLALVALGGYVVGVILQRAVVAPLERVLLAVRDIVERERFDVRLEPEPGPRELDVLRQAFNGLVAHLEERDRQIAAHSEELESRVAERTAELEQAKTRAERFSRFKSEFLSTINHELRTPMDGVLGMTELALDTPLTPQQRDYLVTIKRSADTLIGVLDDMMDLSRIETGAVDLPEVPFDLAGVVHEALSAVVLRAHEKDLDLVWEQSSPLPAMIVAEPVRLRQVLVNLLGNAVKFTNIGQVRMHVEVGEADHAGLAELTAEVRDSGIGIPADVQAEIARLLQEASGGAPQLFGGKGLGLAICARLVHLMRGALTFESHEGAGSTFRVTLPVHVPLGSVRVADVAPPGLDGRDVLIADRFEVSRDLLASWLRGWGARVLCVADEAAALHALHDSPWALVVVAREFVELLRPGLETLGKKGVAIVQLGLATEDDGTRASVTTDASALLMKPLRRPAVAALISSLLERAKARPEPKTVTPAPRPIRVPRVLAADDNPVNLRVITALLAARGCSVATATNGREAVDAWHRERYDLILLDLQMPELGGLDACREIRALEARRRVRPTPVVALTAHVTAADRERCRDAGMDDYLAKPVRRAALHDLLERFGIGAAPTPLDRSA